MEDDVEGRTAWGKLCSRPASHLSLLSNWDITAHEIQHVFNHIWSKQLTCQISPVLWDRKLLPHSDHSEKLPRDPAPSDENRKIQWINFEIFPEYILILYKKISEYIPSEWWRGRKKNPTEIWIGYYQL